MPYIKQSQREVINSTRKVPDDAGELNYLITMITHNYVRKHGERYQTYNDILGALEGAKLELYRMRIAPYENKKLEENGDLI